MKSLITLLTCLMFVLPCKSITWTGMGPDTANISKVCFGVAVQRHVLCADNGFYIFHYGNNTCEFYSYGGLPVVGATHLTADKILLAMGDGSFSDGLYSFHLNTHQFEVIEWLFTPNFLHYDLMNSTFWAAAGWGGVMKSGDGFNWEDVPYFDGRICFSVDSWGNHLAIAETHNNYMVHYSDDGGTTWNSSADTELIRNLCFDGYGNLCGIFPGTSYSSGVYRSTDFGATWELMFYSPELKNLGFDCYGDIFVCWETPGQGLARFDPPDLTYLNDGLPDLNVNSIQLNPVMSAPAIFVSTKSGVYYSLDYMVDVQENEDRQTLNVLPNPASEFIVVSSIENIDQIQIIGLSGDQVKRIGCRDKEVKIDTRDLPAGIYMLQIRSGNQTRLEKVVVK